MKDDYERVKSENFDSYLRKPVLRTDLFATLARFLDHQIIEQDNQQATKIELSAAQQKVLPEVLKKLQQQTDQWQAIQQDNNISDIKKFAGDLVNIAEESGFQPLLVYANQLMEMIDVFDIEGIKGQLTHFSSLLEELQAYDKKAPVIS
jgi:two-component system sensor histidine kinase EvgS